MQDSNMQLSKTWQTFVAQGLSASCKIYGRSGIMRNGIAYRLPPLAHLTDGIGYGLLPTPLASVKSDCPSERKRRNPNLEAVVKMFPTPTSSDYKDVGDLKKLARYAHKSRLACTIAAEELSNGAKSL